MAENAKESPANSPVKDASKETKSSLLSKPYGKILLDISNSVLPLDKLSKTPSKIDGLSEEIEAQIRALGCDLIQTSGKLLKLPQTAMATACVLFHRFYYVKSFIRLPFDITAMACLVLASKIEESPRRARDVINVVAHIKQFRNKKPFTPVQLDMNYKTLKENIIKAERRVLKELGFCVHVKHPHKIIVMYLQWLNVVKNQELLQMSWNFMNDSLRTDVFVRYPPETIAVACIYLSARKLAIPLPKNPAWFDVLGVEEDDIKDCCFRMISLYNRKKPIQEDLEKAVETLRQKLDESRRLAREAQQQKMAAVQSSKTTSRTHSPTNNSKDPSSKDGHHHHRRHPDSPGGRHHRNGSSGRNYDNDYRSSADYRDHHHSRQPRSYSRSPSRNHHGSSSSAAKRGKKHHRRSRSRSPMGNDYYRSGGGRSEYDSEYSQSRNSSSLKKHRRKRSSRTPSLSPEPLAPKKRTYTTSNVVSAGDIKKERKPEEKRNRDKYPRGEDRGRGGIDSYSSRSSNGSSSNRRREDRR